MASSGVPGLRTPNDGDDILRRLEELERKLPAGLASVALSFQGTVADLNAAQATLATAVDDIATQQTTLTQAVSDISDAQDAITAQQATLTAAVSDISDLVDEQVAFTATDDSSSGFSIPTGSTASVLTTTIDVPTGYTEAGVIAVGTVVGINGSGGPSYLYAGIDIDSLSGDLNVGTATANGALGVVRDHQAQVITGLTGGGTFDVVLRAKGDPAWGSSTTSAGLAVLAVFRR